MGGHVFAVHGDIMQLACDAWVVPGSSYPGKTWREAVEWPAKVEMPAGWGTLGGPRVVPWPSRKKGRTVPEPFLVDLAGTNRQGADWHVAGAREFIRVASESVKKRAPYHKRARHLLAMPLVGTGFGGARQFAGDVVRQLLSALHEEAESANVDVALVLFEGPAFAAVQAERLAATDRWFGELNAAEKAAAEDLARKARDGDLVLFLGAGVSQGAGLPSWNAMLCEIAAEEAGVTDLDAFRALGELDQAALLAKRFGPDAHMGAMIARHLITRGTHYALAHGLLAGLPVDEVITTNYDDLFERASAAVGRPVTVLPHALARRSERWLLKMHGCVSRPDAIVVTREDYLRFQENRSALAGIVQALLMTRHMLFHGFSLRDDNFHRIAHAVRSALGERDHRERGARFGTSLVVDPNPLARELWQEDLEWITFASHESGPGKDVAEQVRRAEIFLDLLGARAATTTSHLCDRRYETVLSKPELDLRARLSSFVEEASPEIKATPAWGEVQKLLRRLGQRG